MGNKILEDTQAFLSGLSPDMIQQAETIAAEISDANYPARLTPAEWLHLGKAIKYIVGVDGFSKEEAQGLVAVMQQHHIPEEFAKHVLAFNTGDVTMDAITELFEPGTLKAKQLISGAIHVAILDGFSETERQTTVKIAEKMGFSAKLVDAYEAHTRLELAVAKTNNAELYKATQASRIAQWELS